MSNSKRANNVNSLQSKLGRKYKQPKNTRSAIRIINIPIINLVPYQSKKQYRKKICLYTWNGLCQMLLGAAIMSVMIYAVLHKDAHVALFGIGQNLFLALGILMKNRYNAWSLPYTPRHNKLGHITLQLTGIIISLCGIGSVFTGYSFSVTMHGIIGVIAMTSCLVTTLVGSCVLYSRNTWRQLHRWFGVFSFIMSSASLISGVGTPTYKDWAGSLIVLIIIVSVLIYSTFILVCSGVPSIRGIKSQRRQSDLRGVS